MKKIKATLISEGVTIVKTSIIPTKEFETNDPESQVP